MKTYLKHAIYIAILVMAGLGQGLAQQEAQYTQYMYNTMAINPAYVGSRDAINLNALYRSQWTGVDGAPVTQTFNASAPVSERIGLGLSFLNDEIGNSTYQRTRFGGVFSYSIPFRYFGRLSFGLKAGGSILNIDYNNLRNLGLGVPGDLTNVDQSFSPNFGLGIFYNTDRFYVGISTPGVLETEHFANDNSTETFVSTEQMHLYMISGYVFRLGLDLLFKPATLIRYTAGSPIAADISANFLFVNRFRFGASYRVGSAISGLVGLGLSQNLMIGLAYDYDTTDLGDLVGNGGSFEVFLRYKLGSKKGTFISPQFF